MTSETRTFLAFADIIGIQMECLKCGAKVTRPLGNIQRHPVRCENCNQDWFLGPSEGAKTKFYNFLDQFGEAQKIVEGLAEMGVKVKLSLEMSMQSKQPIS